MTNSNSPRRQQATDQTQLDGHQTANLAAHSGAPTWVKIAGSASAGMLLGSAGALLLHGTAAHAGAQPGEAEVVGTTTGTAGAMSTHSENAAPTHTGSNKIDPQPSHDTPAEPATPAGGASTIYSSAPVASGVTDDMSFSEAFAAARAETGPGGVFQWRGGVYGTYYKTEWDAMSADERADYYESVHLQPSRPAEQPRHEAPRPAEEDTGDDVRRASAQDEEHEDDEVQVEVLGVFHDDESGANYAPFIADGRAGVLVDLDGDGTVDVMGVDMNNDGEITDDEV